MTNTVLKGKILKLNLNHQAPKKDGSTFGCVAIRLDTTEEVILINDKSPAAKYAKEKLDLKVGDEVTITKGGQYNSVMKIQKEGGYTKNTFSGKGKFKTKEYDNSGQIKGMVLNNAIAMAINSSVGEEVTSKMIVNAAKIVLEARTETDKLVEAVLPKTKVIDITTKVDPFASMENTGGTTLKSESSDFSSDDGEQEMPF